MHDQAYLGSQETSLRKQTHTSTCVDYSPQRPENESRRRLLTLHVSVESISEDVELSMQPKTAIGLQTKFRSESDRFGAMTSWKAQFGVGGTSDL